MQQISLTGEPFVWAFSVVPVFTIFFVVDVFWGALILVSQQWRRRYLWLLTVLIWLVAARIDFAHHGPLAGRDLGVEKQDSKLAGEQMGGEGEG
jgi:hypothetical protein